MSKNMQSIVFLCVDCLRQDFLRRSSVDTPYLDTLRNSGVEFTNCFATASTTTPAVASFMTGLYSEGNGVNSLRECELNSSVPTLAEVLNDNRWETCAMVTGPLVTETALNRGFDKYSYRETDKQLVGDWFDTAVETIEDLEDPFFAYIHLWELHDPISVPSEFDTEFYGEIQYGRMLSALDRAIERFIKELPPEVTIILHGDHGESVTCQSSTIQGVFHGQRKRLRYERGIDTRRLERLSNRIFDRFNADIKDHFIEKAHGSTIHDYMTNVPLLLVGPDIGEMVVDNQCRQIDIFPTILDYLDIDISSSIDGKSLFPPESVNSRVAYMRACGEILLQKENWSRGIRWEGKKYIEYPNRDWSPEVYDLESDPKELHCLNDQKLQEQLRTKLPDVKLKDQNYKDVDNRLRDLGYL